MRNIVVSYHCEGCGSEHTCECPDDDSARDVLTFVKRVHSLYSPLCDYSVTAVRPPIKPGVNVHIELAG